MFSIDPATSEDLTAILAIENRSFPQPFSRGLFETELGLDVAHFFTAKADGVVAGYIDFWHVGEEIHLISIATDPERRRSGCASRLIEFMLTYARRHRAREVYLDVRVSNAGAISLYEKFSFERVGVRKNYYRDRFTSEDALVMRRLMTLDEEANS